MTQTIRYSAFNHFTTDWYCIKRLNSFEVFLSFVVTQGRRPPDLIKKNNNATVNFSAMIVCWKLIGISFWFLTYIYLAGEMSGALSSSRRGGWWCFICFIWCLLSANTVATVFMVIELSLAEQKLIQHQLTVTNQVMPFQVQAAEVIHLHTRRPNILLHNI